MASRTSLAIFIKFLNSSETFRDLIFISAKFFAPHLGYWGKEKDMEKLRILVIDDNANHQQGAREQLAEHNLTIVESFPKAMKILGSPQSGRIGTYEGNFDVVLTDMEMPVESLGSLDRSVVRDVSAPYGIILALRAAQVGIKYVAMITDTNHHQGAMSNALDMISSAYWNPKDGVFQIGESRVLFAHAETKRNAEGAYVKQWQEALARLLD